MADGVIEFNMSDGLPPLVMQKLNANFKALTSSDSDMIGSVLSGNQLPDSAPEGTIFINTSTGDVSVWRDLGDQHWGWSSATSSDMAHLEDVVQEVQDVLDATNQHFWYDDRGVRITDISQQEWLDEVTSEHAFDDLSDDKIYSNLLLNSVGMIFRSALNYLVTITRSAITFYDGNGDSQENILSSFGSNGAFIGNELLAHIAILPSDDLPPTDPDHRPARIVFFSGPGKEAGKISVDSEEKAAIFISRAFIEDSMYIGVDDVGNKGLWKLYTRQHHNFSVKWMGGM